MVLRIPSLSIGQDVVLVGLYVGTTAALVFAATAVSGTRERKAF